MLNRIKTLFGKKENTNTISAYENIDTLFDSLNGETVVVEIGEDLIEHEISIRKVIESLREQLKDECGFIMPAVAIKYNYIIQENQFNVYIQEKLVEQRFVVPTADEIAEEAYDALKTVIYDNLDTVFTNEIAEKYVRTVEKNNSLLVWNITGVLSIVDIKKILFDIIMKGKSINNIDYIFEKMGEYILSEGSYPNPEKRYSPHVISEAISKYLYK